MRFMCLVCVISTVVIDPITARWTSLGLAGVFALLAVAEQLNDLVDLRRKASKPLAIKVDNAADVRRIVDEMERRGRAR